MWIIFVLSLSYACGYQLQISPAPLAVFDENSNLTLTCDYNGTLVPLEIQWYSDNVDYSEYTYLNMSCIPLYGTPSQNKTFTCNESIGKFQMTIINAHRDRDGQIWSCALLLSNNTYMYSNWTMLNIRSNLTETSCFKNKNHHAEICPYPLARVKEDETLVIAVKVNVSSVLRYFWWDEYADWYTYIHGSSVDKNCTILAIYGIRPAGFNFTCNPSDAIMTFTWDRVQRDSNGHIFRIYLAFDVPPATDRFIFISVQGTDATAPNATNPVSTTIATISPGSSSTAFTSMVTTTKRPPTFLPDSDATASNSTNPVSTTISPGSSSTTFTPMATTTKPPSTFQPDSCPNTTNQRRTTISPSRSSTASASMISTTKPPPSYAPDPGEYELQLEFDLKVEMEYNETYADKTSPEYQSLATKFSVSLTEVFKSLKGFKSIDILLFRRGSVIVDYSVNVFGTVDVQMVTEEIGSKIVRNLTSIAGVLVNTAYTNESMTRRLDTLRTRDKCSLASANLCPFGYYCKPSIASTSVILCIDRCNSSVCQNNGECYVGHHSHDVQCRCAISENVAYSGERCETKTKVVTEQERNLYLIIACSIVGVILLVFISTVCVINRKRNRLKKRLTVSHVLHLDEMHKMSDNGVPAMDERYVISLNPALRRYPEGYSDGRGAFRHQDQGLDGGYMQVQDSGRRNSDADYDYISPHLETGSRAHRY